MPPTTGAAIGYQTLFQIGDGGSPEAFTPVSQVTSVNPPPVSREAPESTSHDSPDGYREYIGGLKDGGEISLEMNFLPSNATQSYAAGLASHLDSPTPKNYRIVLPSSLGTYSFSGVLTGFAPQTPIDGPMRATATIKVSGKPTFA